MSFLYTQHCCRCQPLFKQFKIMPLPSVYIYFSLLAIHTQRQRYLKHADVHNYPTRNSQNLIPHRSRIVCAAENKLDLSLYNVLPHSIRNRPYESFKNNIKKMFSDNGFYNKQQYISYISELWIVFRFSNPVCCHIMFIVLHYVCCFIFCDCFVHISSLSCLFACVISLLMCFTWSISFYIYIIYPFVLFRLLCS